MDPNNAPVSGEAALPDESNHGTPSRPSGLPENFESVEALANAHREAQRRITELSQPAQEGDGNPSVSETAQEAPADSNTVSPFTPFFDHYQEHGELTDQHYAQLDAMGLSREVVNDYIGAQNARTEARDQEIIGGIGGQEAFDRYAEWAGSTLTEAQVNKINEDLGSDDINVAKFAAASLKAAYEAANGAAPTGAITGVAPGSIGVKPFANAQEFQEAMADPRYAKSEEYRMEVRERIRMSQGVL